MLLTVRLPSGDDANETAIGPIAMADKKNPETRTETEEDEPFLGLRMIWVIDEERMLVQEDGSSLGKRHPMLAEVAGGLCGIPVEADLVSHTDIVVERHVERQGSLTTEFSGERSESAGTTG
jgi:hypothetical protein